MLCIRKSISLPCLFWTLGSGVKLFSIDHCLASLHLLGFFVAEKWILNKCSSFYSPNLSVHIISISINPFHCRNIVQLRLSQIFKKPSLMERGLYFISCTQFTWIEIILLYVLRVQSTMLQTVRPWVKNS